MTLKNQMEPEKQRIQTEFNQLRSILDKEEQRQLKKLEEEERKGLSIIEEAEDELVHQSQALKELISDLEHRCQGSTMELLQVRLTKEPPTRESGQRETNFPALLTWDSCPCGGMEKMPSTLECLFLCSCAEVMNKA